jgi:hypothetical protein
MTVINTVAKTTGYDIKYKVYNDKKGTIKAYRYNRPIYINVKQDKDTKPIKKQKSVPSGLVRDDNAIRTVNILKDYVMNNEEIWCTFETDTFAKNVTDIDEAMFHLDIFTRQRRRAYPGYKYVAIIEPQKRGAWHYHILHNIPCGSEIIPKRPMKRIWNSHKKKWIDIEYYDLKYWTQGFSQAWDIINKTDEQFDIVAYMTDYMLKGDNRLLFGRKKVLKSNNLKSCAEYRESEESEQNKAMQQLINDKKVLKKEKHILATNKYAPNVSIYTFTDK